MKKKIPIWTYKEEIQLIKLVRNEGLRTTWSNKAKRIGNGKRTIQSLSSKWKRIEKNNKLINKLYNFDDPPIYDFRSLK